MPVTLNENQYYMYRDKPLLRQGNTIYYGDMGDKFIIFMQILSNKTIKDEKGEDLEIPDVIMVQLISTDTSKPINERTTKQIVKKGLLDAMDVGITWLEGYNK